MKKKVKKYTKKNNFFFLQSNKVDKVKVYKVE
jgi:hypothetical protein